MENESHARESLYIAHWEHIPSTVIDGIEKNEQMEDEPLDPRLRIYFGEDYIFNQTALFAFGQEQGSARRPQPLTMHRGVVVRLIQTGYPFIDEYGVCYGQIAVKGSGISLNSRLYHHQNELTSDPLGFFGLAHARQEMEISNLFAQYGGRNGRVMANLAINHGRFLKWYGSLGLGESFYDVEKELAKVEKNGDQAALCVRLLGADRYEDYSKSHEKPFGLYSRERILIRAARLLCYEMRTRGRQRFYDHYQLETSLPLKKHLDEISWGKITLENMTSLIFLNIYFGLWNLEVTNSLSQERFTGNLRADINTLNVDAAGIWYDWERSLPGPQYTASKANVFTIGRFYYLLGRELMGAYDITKIFNMAKEAFGGVK